MESSGPDFSIIRYKFETISYSSCHLTEAVKSCLRGLCMFGAPKRLPAFGSHTFPTVITTSVVQDLIEKIAGVDFMMR
jgi:hypothetical protein